MIQNKYRNRNMVKEKKFGSHMLFKICFTCFMNSVTDRTMLADWSIQIINTLLCDLILLLLCHKLLRQKKKIAVFPLTRPTLIFCADPAVFIAILKENKKIFIPTDT